MGLTIHWTFKAVGTRQKARAIVDGLRHAAMDLPFKEVDEVIELAGAACKLSKYDKEDPLRDALKDGRRWIEYDIQKIATGRRIKRIEFYPTHLITFVTHPGEGCEPASFGLCRYPSFVEDSPGRRISTELGRAWHWSQCCKTQYASNPKYGGVENFLGCHLNVVALLDKAVASGIGVKVSDEGNFWESRSVPALVQELGEMNEVMAGLYGSLQAIAGPGLQSEIRKFPNFEKLEAAGFDKPQLALLRQLFLTTGAKFDKIKPPSEEGT
jgi:hypothetical protein